MPKPGPWQAYLPNGGEGGITTSDTLDLPDDVIGLHVGGVGDISIDWRGSGETAQIYTDVSGIFPGIVKRVRTTGTTATKISTLRAVSGLGT